MTEQHGKTTFKGNPLTLIGSELSVGQPAPNAALLANDLTEVNLADYGGKVRVISVVPSLDTPVCDMQTKRFNDEAAKLEGIDIYSVSTDLPFAESRYVNTFGTDDIRMISDHLDTSFGKAYGVLVRELRILARSIFVVDRENVVRYAEYVKEITDHPDYDAALSKAKELAG